MASRMSASPLSTFSAVRTPVRESPNSTKVMATAGRMPTTTVTASSTRDMAAMLLSMRPMNESTISSAEMSIMTPRARSATIRLVSSSWSSIANRSCISTWIETRRQSPILSTGISAIRGSAFRRAVDHCLAEATKGQCESIGHGPLGNHPQFEAEMDDRLRDLRPDAVDDAIGAHQAGGGNGFDQVLRHQRVDCGHPCDVDDGDLCARIHDLLEQALHDGLSALAVEGATQRQGQDTLPQPHDGRGQFEHLPLLSGDYFFAALLEDLGSKEPELVEQHGGGPDLFGEPVRVLSDFLPHQVE